MSDHALPAVSNPSWYSLLRISAKGHSWLGVGGENEWLVSLSPDGPGESLAERTWIPAWPLLERDVPSLQLALSEAAGHREIGPFPFDCVAASGMRSEMDYWAALALDWAANLESNAVLQHACEELTTATWASQAVRHRARRLAHRPEGSNS